MKLVKILALVAFAAGAMSLGACASKKETMSTSSTGTSSSVGMSK